MKKTIQKSSLNANINQAAFLPCSKANGPGSRAVVWVQGCLRRCRGCFNPDMLKVKKRNLVSPEVLAKRILALKNIEGVTFSGGEPFLQAEALGILGEKIVKKGLTIVVFTGYSWEELKNSLNPSWQRLLAVADLLAAGPYIEDRPSNRYLCSSDNQELVFLNDRLKYHPDIVTRNGECGHLAEFTISREGNIITTGLAAGE